MDNVSLDPKRANSDSTDNIVRERAFSDLSATENLFRLNFVRSSLRHTGNTKKIPHSQEISMAYSYDVDQVINQLLMEQFGSEFVSGQNSSIQNTSVHCSNVQTDISDETLSPNDIGSSDL